MRLERVSFSDDAAVALAGDLESELLGQYDGVPGSGGLPAPEIFEPPRGCFLIGFLDARPVACGGVSRYDDRTCELRRMYVVPEFRGRGLSRRLLRALEDNARSLGYARLRLETGNLQVAAIGLYEASDYERIERYGPFAADERSVCFEKALAVDSRATLS